MHHRDVEPVYPRGYSSTCIVLSLPFLGGGWTFCPRGRLDSPFFMKPIPFLLSSLLNTFQRTVSSYLSPEGRHLKGSNDNRIPRQFQTTLDIRITDFGFFFLGQLVSYAEMPPSSKYTPEQTVLLKPRTRSPPCNQFLPLIPNGKPPPSSSLSIEALIAPPP